ncbi:DUF4190 domain-containing protein [Streptacidiphilus fuscans]|uniref:DUF4190 domain-containing protein n=1 Tax=Streptacidiphilus fuscans TaxID=2789292 RepID=A0A931B6V6_9ACTN|nr:DUF4190 domain-containing protein [Streptacidiphilus fuscans]MBF9071323.1 DUF4190 domain-containing protein [Streptacidiphilus fuscans]
MPTPAPAPITPEDVPPPQQQAPQPVQGPLVYPWGYQVPGMEPEPMSGWSGMAIAAFVLGVLGVFPLGMIFGVVALAGIGRARKRGKGLAIAGVILSSVWTVAVGGLVLLMVVFASSVSVSGGSSSGSAVAPPGAGIPIDQLPMGTCFDVPEGTGGSTDVVNVVSCSGQHDRQLFARDSVSGPYPGPDADQFQSTLDCDRLAYADLVDPVGLEAQNALIWSYYPDESQWGDGGTPEISCAIAGFGGSSPLTGDLEPDKSHFTAQQLAFLDLVRPTAVLRAEVNDIDPLDWAQGRAVAAQLAAADRAETQLVTGPSATRTVFTGRFQQQAALELAQDDRVEVSDAQVLARSASPQDWTAALKLLQDDGVPSDVLTIRVNIGLGE